MEASVMLVSFATTILSPTTGPFVPAEIQGAALKPATTQMVKADINELMRKAQALEAAGNYRDAFKAYKAAGQAGHGPASRRVAELYIQPVEGIPRDYVKSVHWYSIARAQGIEVSGMEKR